MMRNVSEVVREIGQNRLTCTEGSRSLNLGRRRRPLRDGRIRDSHKARGTRRLDINLGRARYEPGVSRIQEPIPKPTQQDLNAISKADQKGDVDAAPQKPGEKPSCCETANLRHRFRFTDYGHRAFIMINERLTKLRR